MPFSKKSKASSLPAMGLFLLLSLQLHAQSPWQLKKDQSGVKVYVRDVEGMSLKESKATVQFSGSVDAVVSLVQDFGNYPNWAPRVMEARLVERVSDDVLISYSINDSPWPVSDRDIVLRNALERNSDGSVRIVITALPGKVEQVKSVVRMTYFEGYYLIKPLAQGQVEVTYQAIFDPAGSIPAWMANMAVVDTPFDLLTNMRQKLGG